MLILPRGSQKPLTGCHVNWQHPFSRGALVIVPFEGPIGRSANMTVSVDHCPDVTCFGSVASSWSRTANVTGLFPAYARSDPSWIWNSNNEGVCLECTRASLSDHVKWPRNGTGGATDWIPASGVTFLCIRKKVDTTNRASALTSTLSSTVGNRFQARAPHSDGTVYWDFGGTSSPNRLTVAGLTFSTKLAERWIFTAGRNGSSIWRDGVKLASQSTAITRGVDAVQQINLNMDQTQNTTDLVQFNFVQYNDYPWPDELCRWWSAEPYVHLIGDTAFRRFFIVGTDVTELAPIEYENPCTITQPRLYGKVETGTDTLWAATHPLRDSAVLGGFKEPRLIELGPVTRQASQPNDGSVSANTATAKIADTDRRWRAASDTLGTMRGLPFEFYISSKDQSLANLPPRVLIAGEVYRDAARENMALELVGNDLIGRLYTLSGEERKIPQRFVNASDFPAAPAASLGQGVPIIYGLVEDRGNPPMGGTIPCLDVGVINISGTDYRAVLVCGHAITQFEMGAAGNPADPEIWIGGPPGSVVPIADFGTQIWAPQIPGDTTWAAEFGADPFIDINPGGLGPTRRYTLILMPPGGTYATLLDGGAQFHVDVSGIEDVGDGSGALITDYCQQYYHALVNWLLQNYQSGLWLAAPQFVFVDGVTMLDRIKQSSFTIASNIFTLVRGTAPIGGFVLNTRTSIRDVLKNLNFSIGCLLGQDDYGRFYVKVLDTNRTRFLTNPFTGVVHRTLRDKVDILPGMYAEPQSDWFADNIVHHWAPNYLTGRLDQGFAPVAGSNEVEALNTKKEITLPYIRDDATANAVAAYYLALFSSDPKLVHYSRRGLCGLEDDVLTGLPLTHYNGYGVNGYVTRALWVLTKVFNPKTMHCDFVALDVENLLA